MNVSSKFATGFCILVSAVLSPAVLAAPDLISNEYTHDERCAADGDAFSLRSRTAFKRGFHSGDVDVESGVARFSLWGSFMDIATVTVTGNGLSLRKLDTRNGPHNVAKGCPAEYATVTFELTSRSHAPGSLRGTLVVERPGDTWRVPLSVHASPTNIQVQWDQFAGAPTTSTGSTRPITGTNNSGCSPNDPNCTSLGSVQAPGRPVGASGGGSITSHVFSSLKRCLNEQGGDASLDAPDKLVVKVPRDRVVNCQERIRADQKTVTRGVAIQARAESDEFATRVASVAPRTAEFFYGVADDQEFVVGFRWEAIRDRFRPLTAQQPVQLPPGVSPAVTAVEARVPGRPALPPPVIEAEFEMKLNGRVHAPLLVRVEAMP